MPIPRLRRGPRTRTLDDDDWGTSSPAAIMEASLPPPQQPTPALHASPTSSPRLAASPDASLSIAISRLKQQELKSYTCTFSPRCVISIYFVIAITFLPIGASIVASTSSLSSSQRFTYSNNKDCQLGSNRCILMFNVSKTLQPPSYLFYSVSNFHQNARDYVKSRSDIMNRGIVPKARLDIENCERWLCEDGGSDCTTGADGSFSATDLIYPCGLVARSFFNDSFAICRGTDRPCPNEDAVNVRKKGIAWWTDAKYKFEEGEAPQYEKNSSLNPGGRSANDLLEDEDFVVWMRLSAFSTFDKLYRIIEEPIIANTTYYMHIDVKYPVEQFKGAKFFYITNTTWFGTGNVFLGTAYLLVGMTALFIAVTFLFKHVLNPAAPSNIDPAILLREHLEKLNIDSPDPLHQH